MIYYIYLLITQKWFGERCCHIDFMTTVAHKSTLHPTNSTALQKNSSSLASTPSQSCRANHAKVRGEEQFSQKIP